VGSLALPVPPAGRHAMPPPARSVGSHALPVPPASRYAMPPPARSVGSHALPVPPAGRHAMPPPARLVGSHALPAPSADRYAMPPPARSVGSLGGQPRSAGAPGEPPRRKTPSRLCLDTGRLLRPAWAHRDGHRAGSSRQGRARFVHGWRSPRVDARRPGRTQPNRRVLRGDVLKGSPRLCPHGRRGLGIILPRGRSTALARGLGPRLSFLQAVRALHDTKAGDNNRGTEALAVLAAARLAARLATASPAASPAAGPAAAARVGRRPAQPRCPRPRYPRQKGAAPLKTELGEPFSGAAHARDARLLAETRDATIGKRRLGLCPVRLWAQRKSPQHRASGIVRALDVFAPMKSPAILQSAASKPSLCISVGAAFSSISATRRGFSVDSPPPLPQPTQPIRAHSARKWPIFTGRAKGPGGGLGARRKRSGPGADQSVATLSQ
jgi:hypothetical protein